MLSDLLSLIYPSCCEACLSPLVKGEDLICTMCRLDLPVTEYHLETDNRLTRRFYGLTDIAYGTAFLKFTKSGRIQRLLHRLKYGNVPEIGHVLGRWYGYRLGEVGFKDKADLIIPVPLHKTRMRTRGYNQSMYVAEGLSEQLGIPVAEHALRRVRKTSTQTKKGRIERLDSMRGVFAVVEKEAVKGKRIMLVDDVVTTGATLIACMEELHAAGAKEVGVVALAAGD